MKRIVIFTDLDGTLLDYSSYSFEKALPALELLREKKIPLVICSSKTRKEIEHYRKKLDNRHPFVSENGGGIFIPKGYFESALQTALPSPPKGEERVCIEEGDYLMIRLGAPYAALRKAVEELRSEGFPLRGFGDMTAGELAGIARMTLDEAVMAQERDFDEPFLFEGDESEVRALLAAIVAKGFRHTRGRFFHIIGNSDKGKAVDVLADLYRREFGEIVTIAAGDNLNDLPMLERADYPVVVRKADGSYEPGIAIPDLIRAEGIGPEGWNKAVIDLVKTLTA